LTARVQKEKCCANNNNVYNKKKNNNCEPAVLAQFGVSEILISLAVAHLRVQNLGLLRAIMPEKSDLFSTNW
jgi:hypothetical protein